ncbi:MFS transporter [Rheinheimera baltica]|uniref:MFS transporter n=1 Tax=Rheinheimera baltica TaxID=67576 RepID=A0ABT9HUK7_9GAMM|nr:MFS transporter [Rheinheimera baltica]MDP5134814.1 MFS transporter [Rheinheimera baltica]
MSTKSPYRSFSALFLTTLLMLVAQGSLSTYLGLSLAQQNVDSIWIGALMSCYYLGLVLGSKLGHKVIAQVGHIRAFVASAAIVSACAMTHVLTNQLEIWLLMRIIVGMGMMCQYMVLESWLNEQTESSQRGTVFAFYMITSYLGMIGGQLMLSQFPELGISPLLIISMCYSLCIVPIALTKRIHPAPLQPAPLKILAFWRQVPQSLTAVTVAGMMAGSFYGLAPAYAASKGMETEQVTLFMSMTILAGLLAQWPMGKISDRIPRSRILRFNAAALTILTLLIALLPLTGIALLLATFCYGILAFTLYPIASAFANQNVEQNDRVALSATILLTFGLGACFGPLLASTLMQFIGPVMLYAFISCCAFTLFLRLLRVNYTQKQVKRMLDQQQNAQFKMGSGDLVSSPLAAALDPRVDEDTVMTQMHDEDFIATRRQVPAGYDEDIEQEVADDSFDALVISESESANQSNN